MKMIFQGNFTYLSTLHLFFFLLKGMYDFILLFKGTTVEPLLRDTSVRGIQNWVPLICSQSLCLWSRHPCLISIWENLRTEDMTLTASFRNLN